MVKKKIKRKFSKYFVEIFLFFLFSHWTSAWVCLKLPLQLCWQIVVNLLSLVPCLSCSLESTLMPNGDPESYVNSCSPPSSPCPIPSQHTNWIAWALPAWQMTMVWQLSSSLCEEHKKAGPDHLHGAEGGGNEATGWSILQRVAEGTPRIDLFHCTGVSSTPSVTGTMFPLLWIHSLNSCLSQSPPAPSDWAGPGAIYSSWKGSLH